MTTQAFEQFDVMDTQALAAVEGGGYWDDYTNLAGLGAAIGAFIATDPNYRYQCHPGETYFIG